MDTLSLGRLSIAGRLSLLRENGVLDKDDIDLLKGPDLAGLAENVIGAFAVPLGLATHFVINGEQRLIAMATEERSVIAAASKAARLCPDGFQTMALDARRRCRAQILYAGLEDPKRVRDRFLEEASGIAAMLRRELTGMDKYGGGLAAIEPKLLTTESGTILVLDLDIDTDEAMGANVVTKMAEAAAVLLVGVTGVRRTAAICCNRDAGISVAAEATWSAKEVRQETLDRALKIHEWAAADPDRACTHNKGIMNAVTAIALATGQDTRAIEACCHSQAMSGSSYQPLSHFEMTAKGLSGTVVLKLPVGTVGGATSHPMAALCRKIMGVSTSEDLACVMAAAGLAQNFGALRALADEGIPESHRRLSGKRK